MRRITPSWDMAMWIVAVVALTLSVLNWVEANRPAEVRLVLADQVRLTVGPEAQVYLQPVIVSTGANARAEVIDAATASMLTPDGATVELVWTQTGAFEVGPFPDYAVSWRITSLRPEPIVVTPADPQTPVLRWRTSGAFTWTPGAYRIELRTNRLVSADPLIGALLFDLSPADVEELSTEGPQRFVAFDATSGDR